MAGLSIDKKQNGRYILTKKERIDPIEHFTISSFIFYYFWGVTKGDNNKSFPVGFDVIYFSNLIIPFPHITYMQSSIAAAAE